MNTHSYSNEAFHTLYLAVRKAYNEHRDIFTIQECRRILAAIMAAKSFSYRVVGVTEAALQRFEELDFKRKKNHGIVRGHIEPIFETVKKLLERGQLFEPKEFMDFWIGRDKTVFCLKNENKETIPSYLTNSNEDGKLFSCDGVLAGWQHKRPERDYLRKFHEDYHNGEIKPINYPPSTLQTA